MQSIFGNKSFGSSVSIPGHLNCLVKNLPPGYNCDANYIIDNHTLFPFYAPFLDLERRNRLIENMCNDGRSGRHITAGVITRGGMSAISYMRYCPVCFEEDSKLYGEPYWHRIHQVPILSICPMHNTFIEESDLKIINRLGSDIYDFVSAAQVLQSSTPRYIDMSNKTHCQLLYMARDAKWLLDSQNVSLLPEENCHKYHRLLVKYGFANPRGRVDSERFVQNFVDYYSEEFLHKMNCSLNIKKSEIWLLKLLRPSDKVKNPIYHLLLMQYLRCEIEEFAKIIVDDHPFGQGPWRCLNPFCKFYQNLSISNCTITFDTSGQPVGVFECVCGFAYMCKTTDMSIVDLNGHRQVKSYGHIWEEGFKRIWDDESLSMAKKAQCLRMDNKTLKRHALSLGLQFPPPGRRNIITMPSNVPNYDHKLDSERRNEYRRIILVAIEENPETTKEQLQERFSKEIRWLESNDLGWFRLLRFRESRKPTAPKGVSNGRANDWYSIDLRISKQVKEIASQISSEPGKPVRISISEIARRMAPRDAKYMLNKKEKLPITCETLVNIIDTTTTFALRRIDWAVNYYIERSELPSIWQFKRLVALENLKSPGILYDAIEVAFEKLLLRLK